MRGTPRTGKGKISSSDTKPENPFPKKKKKHSKKHSKQQAMVRTHTLVQKNGKIAFRDLPQKWVEVSVDCVWHAKG